MVLPISDKPTSRSKSPSIRLECFVQKEGKKAELRMGNGQVLFLIEQAMHQTDISRKTTHDLGGESHEWRVFYQVTAYGFAKLITSLDLSSLRFRELDIALSFCKTGLIRLQRKMNVTVYTSPFSIR